MKINWQLSSIEDIARQVIKLDKGLLRQQTNYYRFTCNLIMIDKIVEIKKFVKLYKLEAEVIKLKARLGVS